MKKKILLSLLISCSLLNAYSQEEKEDACYIYELRNNYPSCNINFNNHIGITEDEYDTFYNDNVDDCLSDIMTDEEEDNIYDKCENAVRNESYYWAGPLPAKRLKKGFSINNIDFDFFPLNKKSASMSNGGLIKDSDVLKDGVGVYILSAKNESFDFSSYNNLFLNNIDLLNQSNKNLIDLIPVKFLESGFNDYDKNNPDSSKYCYGLPTGVIYKGKLVVDNNTIREERDKGTDMGILCTSNVTDMDTLFLNTDVNGDITQWDTSHVTNMHKLFAISKNFNQPIGNWVTSSVTNMNEMFAEAYVFNQPLNNWDVSKVQSMRSMFAAAYKFNQSLNKWNMSSVKNISFMFSHANNFNSRIDNWDTSNITDMSFTFLGASNFNQNLSKWDTSNVKTMVAMFSKASRFNQPLNDWDVSNVTNMGSMFGETAYFNQPLDRWNTSKVTNMGRMFFGSFRFNQSLNNWNISNVRILLSTFERTGYFNQPLDKWDTSIVIDMDYLFNRSDKFNQDISNWDLSNNPTHVNFDSNAKEWENKNKPLF